MCWWQVWYVGDRFRILVTDLIHWENHQNNESYHMICAILYGPYSMPHIEWLIWHGSHTVDPSLSNIDWYFRNSGFQSSIVSIFRFTVNELFYFTQVRTSIILLLEHFTMRNIGYDHFTHSLKLSEVSHSWKGVPSDIWNSWGKLWHIVTVWQVNGSSQENNLYDYISYLS